MMLRGNRDLGVWLLVALCIIAGAERRITEVALDQISPGTNLLNDASLDDEDTRVRLIAVDKLDVPNIEEPSILLVGTVLVTLPQRLLLFAAHRSSPRAPPPHSS